MSDILHAAIDPYVLQKNTEIHDLEVKLQNEQAYSAKLREKLIRANKIIIELEHEVLMLSDETQYLN